MRDDVRSHDRGEGVERGRHGTDEERGRLEDEVARLEAAAVEGAYRREGDVGAS